MCVYARVHACLIVCLQFNIRVHLYRIYHLLKGKIESGPVDALTYKARNCISEDLFLQEEIVYQVTRLFGTPTAVVFGYTITDTGSCGTAGSKHELFA